jgi:hypothetical protein
VVLKQLVGTACDPLENERRSGQERGVELIVADLAEDRQGDPGTVGRE